MQGCFPTPLCFGMDRDMCVPAHKYLVLGWRTQSACRHGQRTNSDECQMTHNHIRGPAKNFEHFNAIRNVEEPETYPPGHTFEHVTYK